MNQFFEALLTMVVRILTSKMVDLLAERAVSESERRCPGKHGSIVVASTKQVVELNKKF